MPVIPGSAGTDTSVSRQFAAWPPHGLPGESAKTRGHVANINAVAGQIVVAITVVAALGHASRLPDPHSRRRPDLTGSTQMIGSLPDPGSWQVPTVAAALAVVDRKLAPSLGTAHAHLGRHTCRRPGSPFRGRRGSCSRPHRWHTAARSCLPPTQTVERHRCRRCHRRRKGTLTRDRPWRPGRSP